MNLDLPIKEFQECFFGDENEYNNLLKTMKIIYEKVIGAMLGGIAEIIAKIYEFLTSGLNKVLNAILKISQDGGKELNSILDEYVFKPLSELIKISSNPFIWLADKIYNIFQDVQIPLPEIKILNIVLIKSNEAYNKTIENIAGVVDDIQEWVTSKFSGLIDFIISFIKLPIEWILKEIEDLKKLFSNIFNELVNDAVGFFKKLADWFLGLVSPLNKIIDNILNLIVKLFVKSEEEISKVIIYLKTLILELLSNFTPEKFSSLLDSIDDKLNPYIKTIFRFIICSVKSLLKIIEYLFTFKFLSEQ